MLDSDPTPDRSWATDPESLDTREVRWFANGPLPEDVVEWFMSIGNAPSIEERTDAYLLTGRSDLGVKRRERSDLEIKRRTGRPGTVFLEGIGIGWIELWTKVRRSEMDGQLAGAWVDVDKYVLTDRRSFESEQGTAVCEIEIASVAAAGVSAWTLAFEAYGPRPTRSISFDEALTAFARWSGRPSFLEELSTTAGYPEWLESLALAAGLPISRLHPA